MNDAHALVFTFDADTQRALAAADGLRAALPRIGLPDGVDEVRVFSPHPDHARLTTFDDGTPPLAIVEYRAAAQEPLRRLAGDAGLRAALARAGEPTDWRARLFRVLSEPVPEPLPDGAQAPLSLVVHYYGPTADPAAFAAHYVTHHPAILARLPRVREVLCYLPAGPALPGLRADPTVIRNEVGFDTMDELIAALGSPVRADLSADTRAFPPFGRSTHYPMLRLRAA